ncbi:hypothetical protein PMAYCL1PPCAC_10998 [Pristionchus mayeri]|uniref:Uncharacterized protein n=1 Tax=Pristionchus mayeri TaxID=1317129 RepID=A0AAN5C7W4_9BILA|nr:hypothetical protein PMAYCL1PPCAC_10998 [Pristionchus mayeri]
MLGKNQGDLTMEHLFGFRSELPDFVLHIGMNSGQNLRALSTLVKIELEWFEILKMVPVRNSNCPEADGLKPLPLDDSVAEGRVQRLGNDVVDQDFRRVLRHSECHTVRLNLDEMVQGKIHNLAFVPLIGRTELVFDGSVERRGRDCIRSKINYSTPMLLSMD